MQDNSTMRLRTLSKGVHVLMRLLDVYSRCKAEDRRMKVAKLMPVLIK